MSSAWLPGIMGPDTAPCRTRNIISDGRLHARPQSREATVNNATDMTKVRTTPNRCINQPVSGTDTPLATANDVITQVPWSELTPRLPAIVGIDTFAMDVSSTCIKVPNAKANAVKVLAVPDRAGGPASAAPAVPALDAAAAPSLVGAAPAFA